MANRIKVLLRNVRIVNRSDVVAGDRVHPGFANMAAPRASIALPSAATGQLAKAEPKTKK